MKNKKGRVKKLTKKEMNNEILEKQLNVDEKPSHCEKCGEEIGKRLVDDEIVNYCKECNWISY